MPDQDTGALHDGGAGHNRARALSAVAADPSRTLIALDFDGTLAPIVPRPELAVAHPEADVALARLAGAGYRLAIVTGRPVADVLRLGSGFGDVPGLTIYGHYGMETWNDGRLVEPPVHEGVPRARDALRALSTDRDGVHVEDKVRAVALHTRNASDPAAELDALRPAAERIAADCGLETVPGRFVLELRPAGIDKGVTLREVVSRDGITGVVFAGDDLGDLPAVRALREMSVAAFVVCSDSPETPHELRQAADVVVDGPAGVIAFLRVLAGDDEARP